MKSNEFLIFSLACIMDDNGARISKPDGQYKTTEPLPFAAGWAGLNVKMVEGNLLLYLPN
jgi:hypothetical protein